MKNIPDTELLTNKEIDKLFDKMNSYKREKNKVAVRNVILSHNYRLIKSIAIEHIKKNSSLNYSDLFGEGIEAAIKGIQNFDKNKGYKLSTYLSSWIRQAMAKYIADNKHPIQLKKNASKKLNKIRDYITEFIEKYNRSPTSYEISRATKIKIVEIDAILAASQPATSIHWSADIDEEGERLSVADLLLDKDDDTLEDKIDDIRNEKLVMSILYKMPRKESKIYVSGEGIFMPRRNRILKNILSLFSLEEKDLLSIEDKARLAISSKQTKSGNRLSNLEVSKLEKLFNISEYDTRERMILCELYNIVDNKKYTQKELGSIFKRSKKTIERIQLRAEDKIKERVKQHQTYLYHMYLNNEHSKRYIG